MTKPNLNSICIVHNDYPFAQQLPQVLAKQIPGFNPGSVDIYTDINKAYVATVRKQYDFFITKMDMPQFSGSVFLKKIRMRQNYGLELHLFLLEGVGKSFVEMMFGHDSPYILEAPITADRVGKAVSYIIQKEDNLTPFDEQYRQVRFMYQSGLHQEAFTAAQELQRQHVKSDAIYLLLGDMAKAQGKMEQAIEYYQMAVRLNNKAVLPPHKLISCWIELRKLDKAIAFLEMLLQLNPQNIDSLLNMIYVQIELSMTPEEKKYLPNVKNLDPAVEESRMIAAQVHLELVNDYITNKKLTDSDSSLQELFNYLRVAGHLMVRKQDWRTGIKLYAASLQLSHSIMLTADLLFHIGQSYFYLQDNQMAQLYLEQALRLKPDLRLAKLALQKIQNRL